MTRSAKATGADRPRKFEKDGDTIAVPRPSMVRDGPSCSHFKMHGTNWRTGL